MSGVIEDRFFLFLKTGIFLFFISPKSNDNIMSCYPHEKVKVKKAKKLDSYRERLYFKNTKSCTVKFLPLLVSHPRNNQCYQILKIFSKILYACAN